MFPVGFVTILRHFNKRSLGIALESRSRINDERKKMRNGSVKRSISVRCFDHPMGRQLGKDENERTQWVNGDTNGKPGVVKK